MTRLRRRALVTVLLALVALPGGCCGHCRDEPELPDFVREARARRRCEREQERRRENGQDDEDGGILGAIFEGFFAALFGIDDDEDD